MSISAYYVGVCFAAGYYLSAMRLYQFQTKKKSVKIRLSKYEDLTEFQGKSKEATNHFEEKGNETETNLSIPTAQERGTCCTTSLYATTVCHICTVTIAEIVY